MSVLRIAVASDLHAYDEADGPAAPSHFCVRNAGRNPGVNPIKALEVLIGDQDITTDLFLCPGDLTDKAHPAGLVHAWQAVNDLRGRLRAPILAATTGNHDVDSHRKYSSYSEIDTLKSLRPLYPLPSSDAATNNQYWSRGFAVIENDTYRLVVLNSSEYHSTPDEVARGRVGERVLTELAEAIDGDAPGINVLLCHHHPHQHMEIGLGEDDVMRSGQLLLDLLGSGNHGRWLVIHGHKHHPKITYASGGSASAVVLAAGSVSAQIFPALHTVARNQFYVITVSANPHSNIPFGGTVEAWDWAAGTGWKHANPDSGLPHQFGFGYRLDPAIIAKHVVEAMSGPKMPWTEVEAKLPELKYLLPRDLQLVQKHLSSDHGVNVESHIGYPPEIGRPQ